MELRQNWLSEATDELSKMGLEKRRSRMNDVEDEFLDTRRYTAHGADSAGDLGGTEQNEIRRQIN